MDQTAIDQFKQMLPDKAKRGVSAELIQKIQQTLSEPDMYETYRENLLSYASVMADGKFKLTNYIDAVKYVSHKLRGMTNIEAFSLTFPDKIQAWSNQGVAGKDVASYVSAYHKSKLVGLLLEQSLVPSWVLNQDIYQKAINTQAELMVSARSEKVRSDAANSLLTHLKPPEANKLQIDVNTGENKTLDALKEVTMELVRQQRLALQAGVTDAQKVAHSPITIEGERG